MTVANRTIVITGGTGFIGSALARELSQDNEVICLDLPDAIERAEQHRSLGTAKTVVADVTDKDVLRDVIPPHTHMILHLAAMVGVKRVTANPLRTVEVNMVGTANVLEVATQGSRLEQLERVVVFSTSEVFGGEAAGATETDLASIRPCQHSRWSYAASKLCAEHLAMAYHRELDLPAVVVRPFNIFGPQQVVPSAMHVFTRQAVSEVPITVYGDGCQVRAWCHVDDIVRGVMLCLDSPEAVGRSFNVGNPERPVSTLELAQLIKETAGSDSPIEHKERDPGDIAVRIPDISRAEALLGYTPQVSLTDGIEETLAWHKARQRVDTLSRER